MLRTAARNWPNADGAEKPSCVLLPADDVREAHRALKGSTLRIEVYADDSTARAEHPYTVTEQNFTISRLQERGPNRHSVFLSHARESLVYLFEPLVTSKPLGLGLGLATAKALIENQNGSIRVSSTGDSRGARFEIRVPRAPFEG